MSGRADRLQRVLRVRELQHRQAMAARGAAQAKLLQIEAMIRRIDQISQAYAPVTGTTDAEQLKAAAYQRERLQAPRAASQAQQKVAARQAAAADAAGLDAFRRQKAAEKLHARAQATERIEAERRADRLQPPKAQPRREGED